MDSEKICSGSLTTASHPLRMELSSTPTPGHEYEVFLSFRGPDTRRGFTDYLYHSLRDAGIHVFRDDEELRKGEEIGPELLQVIKQSKISIPVFSRGYASSKWCLMELTQMVECRRTANQTILPIFYNVTPNQVRHQAADTCYSEAFSQHINKYEEQMVQQWRNALAEVGALNGWDLDAMNGYEGELIKSLVKEVLFFWPSLVKEVLSNLKKAQLILTDKLVGIEDHVKEVMRLSEIGAKDVRLVGLWGMGGIGKTTLAKFIFNRIVHDFECWSFIDDIREATHRNGLKYLQSLLVSNLSKHEHPEFTSTDEGIQVIRSRFRDKKVRVLLDDVDRIEQLDKLVVELNSFGPGSRFIVTTRNRDVLSRYEVNFIYEVEELDQDRAFELFCKHAFGKGSPPIGLGAIPKEICKTTGGLPLALEVVGSLLFGKRKDKWEATLKKLREMPYSTVQDKLKISYEALDYRQKQIFLDIACLFIGVDKDIASYMWKDCKFLPEDGIDVLVKMSLVKIKGNDVLWMHDQLRDFGKEIVRQNCEHDIRKQSRLWEIEEATQVLDHHEGSSMVEAIRLNVKRFNREPRVCLTKNQFKHLPKLRYLEIWLGNLDGDFQNLLSNLRWFRYSVSSLNSVSNLNPKNLVVLQLWDTDIRDDWKGWSSIKMTKLKVLDFRGNRKLARIPDFLAFPYLEVLIFKCCFNLKVDPSIWKLQVDRLQALETLDTRGRPTLKRLPSRLLWKNVGAIDSNVLQELEGLNQLEAQEELEINECRVIEKLSNLENLKFLKKLDTSVCRKLQGFEGLDQLAMLEELDINGCEAIKMLPNLKNLILLKTLDASGCRELHGLEGLDQLEALEELHISECNAFKRLPSLSNLKLLKKLDASWCEKLQGFEGLEDLEGLEELCISGCEEIEKLPSLKKLKLLEKLDSSYCRNLQELEGLDRFKALQELNIYKCGRIKKLPGLKKLKLLRKLYAGRCIKLQELEGLDELEVLQELIIDHCEAIKKLPSLKNLKLLEKLDTSYCRKLCGLEGLDQLEVLQELYIHGCEVLDKLPNLKNLKLLKKLDGRCCRNLRELKGLDQLETLQELNIGDCGAIQKLPSLKNLKLLKTLDASWCIKLNELEGLDHLEALQELYICGCEAIEKFPSLRNLTVLRKLDVSWCLKLQELEGLDQLKALQELNVCECEAIEKLPSLKILQELKICGLEAVETLSNPKDISLKLTLAVAGSVDWEKW